MDDLIREIKLHQDSVVAAERLQELAATVMIEATSAVLTSTEADGRKVGDHLDATLHTSQADLMMASSAAITVVDKLKTLALTGQVLSLP
jgi:predicted amidohydrolase